MIATLAALLVTGIVGFLGSKVLSKELNGYLCLLTFIGCLLLGFYQFNIDL